ncbi:cation diffusion facilitator family transporter [Silvanigrella paludirubra]|uniref:Cation diffusion facilitator family transporter n=1 Tax=Silvanigrella paludirubra TaxID=2499159 RepID=A0A6N6VRF7_9BACT|nr:cation diffusion facilitator family transporter [Silvanigrella paludirubra]KAB8038682.1 cation diffusion facilitator family transporter [Silvanigrella paludirubra]
MQIEHSKDSLDSKIAQRAALTAALCAAVLALGKLILFLLTGSMVVALSAWDSTMDMLVSLVNRKIVKFSRLDPDNNHPYGHGRVESIAALGQGCLIIGGAIGIIASSARQIYDSLKGNVTLDFHADWRQVAFFVFAGMVSFYVTKMLKRNGDKLNSPALLADSEHYKVDLVTNIASGIAIFIVILFGNPILDPIIALVFSLYIIYGAFGLVKTSINELMDHDISDEIKIKAKKIIKETDSRVLDIHRFRGRKSGYKYFFDFHVTLPDELSFNEVHIIIEKIEDSLELEFDGDVIVHADPSSVRMSS